MGDSYSWPPTEGHMGDAWVMLQLACYRRSSARVKNAQVVTDLQTSCCKTDIYYQDVFALLVLMQFLRQVSNKLLSPCYKVEDGNRLATSCSNKTNTCCS
jgi:hypothetical protein